MITDPAVLEVVFALDGLQVGDIILMGPDEQHDTAYDREELHGEQLRVTEIYPDETFLADVERIDLPSEGAVTCITRKNVVGWQRGD